MQPKDGTEEEAMGDESDSSDDDITAYLENDNDESDEDEEERSPYDETMVKLKDKISLLKFRCENGLGANLFEQAYKLVKDNREKNVSAERTREVLIGMLGQK